ncbi:hypothetical protein EG68_01265 [Paragonimus skrjabini miyazakii]|uniref:Uncharacterized protein n=1 Tax=Paragonimus skrjabini miyazakii TaxID=59628 RepID=A0A8S9ZBH9_9TREM|nr:hypothetical protein EG68_01265 [Paragonimus skrjabini miyazakii]
MTLDVVYQLSDSTTPTHLKGWKNDQTDKVFRQRIDENLIPWVQFWMEYVSSRLLAHRVACMLVCVHECKLKLDSHYVLSRLLERTLEPDDRLILLQAVRIDVCRSVNIHLQFNKGDKLKNDLINS